MAEKRKIPIQFLQNKNKHFKLSHKYTRVARDKI